jgi:hypothetical protein
VTETLIPTTTENTTMAITLNTPSLDLATKYDPVKCVEEGLERWDLKFSTHLFNDGTGAARPGFKITSTPTGPDDGHRMVKADRPVYVIYAAAGWLLVVQAEGNRPAAEYRLSGWHLPSVTVTAYDWACGHIDPCHHIS